MTTKRVRMVATVLLLAGSAIVGKSISAAAKPSSSPHVMVVMMENRNFSDVIGASDQPYTNSLATANGLATQSYATAPGSLPNYLALVSGSTQGTDNVTPSQRSFPNTATVADQLFTAGYAAKAYAENLPADPTNSLGNYSILHFPWPYFPNAHITSADASALLPDLNGASAPDFVWYTPNVINDEDAGTTQQGDAFLSSFIPQVQATPWYKAGGQIIIEWDESNNDKSGIGGGTGGGRIPTIVVSAALAAHPLQDSTPVDSLGILHSIEDVYGLPYLDFAANAFHGNIDSLLTTASTTTTTTTAATTTTTAPAATTTTTAPAATTTTTAPAATTTTTAPPATTTTTAPSATTSTTGAAPTTTRPVVSVPATTSPAVTTPRPATAASPLSSSRGTVIAASGALALTGPDKGLGLMVLIGVALIVLGLALFALDHLSRVRRLGAD